MDQDAIAKLKLLRSQPKFVDEPGTIYNGMRPETVREKAERQLNKLIDRLIFDPEDALKEKLVLRQFRLSLAHFPGYDTEDRERMCRYLV